jgi:hypothetical protein
MPNYLTGRIFRLVCNKSGLQFFGSTCSPLSAKLSQMKSQFKKNRLSLANKILEGADYCIVLCEDYPSLSRENLLSRLRWYIENHDCLNKAKRDEYEIRKQKIISGQLAWDFDSRNLCRQNVTNMKNTVVVLDGTMSECSLEFTEIYDGSDDIQFPEFTDDQKKQLIEVLSI